jgi:hypothetical protein
MPDSVIKKVEGYGRRGAAPGEFDFADRSGVLFEWNESIDKHPQGLVEEEVVLYPTLAAELPGVTIGRDIPVTAVEDDIVPQGRAEDAVAANAGLAPMEPGALGDVAVIDAHAYEYAPDVDDADDDGIIAVMDIRPAHFPAPAMINDGAIALEDDAEEIYGDLDAADDASVHTGRSSDDSSAGAADDNDTDDDDDDDDDDADALARAAGLRRSSRSTKGLTTRFDNYSLLMHARRAARAGPKRAIIKDRFMMFSAEDLSDAKPVPVEDRNEYALGVILQQYSVMAGLRKFKERGEVGVTKELSQMHNMSVFTPVHKESLSAEEKKKAVSSLMLLKENRDESVKARFCADGRKQRGLVGNSDFGFRFLGRPEFGIPFPNSGFRNFPAEYDIGTPKNLSSRKSEFRFPFFRNSGIPLITYIGTKYILIL